MLLYSGTFVSEEVTHVEGDVDPVRDLAIIHDELRLKDEEYLNKQIDGLEKTVLRGDKTKRAEYVSALYTPLYACVCLEKICKN